MYVNRVQSRVATSAKSLTSRPSQVASQVGECSDKDYHITIGRSKISVSSYPCSKRTITVELLDREMS